MLFYTFIIHDQNIETKIDEKKIDCNFKIKNMPEKNDQLFS